MTKDKFSNAQPEDLMAVTAKKRVLETVRNKRDFLFKPADKIENILKWTTGDYKSGRFRIMLYRFLTDHIPLINSCIWTWVRLASAPGSYKISGTTDKIVEEKARRVLEKLYDRLYSNTLGNRTGTVSLLPMLFSGLFRDGLFGGFLTVNRDFSGVDRFLPIDSVDLGYESEGIRPGLYLDRGIRRWSLDRPDFYYLSLSNDPGEPLGRSILKSVPFISYIEQQLVNDMQKTSHNSGYHRLHVKITPPERMAGESDNAYTERINGYFDATVRMIKTCDIDDNPVTWDNVAIEYIGPDRSRDISNSWFMNHRAMIEDICAGTNLAPYLLGYSFGATTTWSNFKFDVVMRQVRSVQAEVARFMEWVGNIELALTNFEATCRFVFDNSFAYQAMENVNVQSARVNNILKLFEAGLVEKKAAEEIIRELI
ncbi:MAG: hypothetical protein PHN52_05625 [candidate division Zixibacteria bacterium]|nr:hypothetical protein [candidate division Zixibacteria bacterium]